MKAKIKTPCFAQPRSQTPFRTFKRAPTPPLTSAVISDLNTGAWLLFLSSFRAPICLRASVKSCTCWELWSSTVFPASWRHSPPFKKKKNRCNSLQTAGCRPTRCCRVMFMFCDPLGSSSAIAFNRDQQLGGEWGLIRAAYQELVTRHMFARSRGGCHSRCPPLPPPPLPPDHSNRFLRLTVALASVQ